MKGRRRGFKGGRRHRNHFSTFLAVTATFPTKERLGVPRDNGRNPRPRSVPATNVAAGRETRQEFIADALVIDFERNGDFS